MVVVPLMPWCRSLFPLHQRDDLSLVYQRHLDEDCVAPAAWSSLFCPLFVGRQLIHHLVINVDFIQNPLECAADRSVHEQLEAGRLDRRKAIDDIGRFLNVDEADAEVVDSSATEALDLCNHALVAHMTGVVEVDQDRDRASDNDVVKVVLYHFGNKVLPALAFQNCQRNQDDDRHDDPKEQVAIHESDLFLLNSAGGVLEAQVSCSAMWRAFSRRQ